MNTSDTALLGAHESESPLLQSGDKTPLLQIKNLDIAFVRDKDLIKATDGVHLEVNPGEIVCLVGESGCGKSITALSILGLLGGQGRVVGGEILYDGRDLLKMSEAELDKIRGNEISMVFQDALGSLNPVFTVGNQMTESIRIHLGYDRKKAREHAIKLLEKTGIPDPGNVLRKYPHMLSGGMRQRVMIAMALSCHPRLLIADEPTTALDVTIQLQIMQLILKLRDELNMGVLLITHDLGVVAELADRVVVMYAGQCVEEALVDGLFEAPGHPYTRALLEAVPDIHDHKERKLFSIPGAVPEDYHEMTGCRFAPRCIFADGCPGDGALVHLDTHHYARCSRAGEERRTADEQ